MQGLSLRVDSAGFMVDGLRDDLQLQHERADGTIRVENLPGLGFVVWGLTFGVCGLEFWVWYLGFGVWGLGFRVEG